MQKATLRKEYRQKRQDLADRHLIKHLSLDILTTFLEHIEVKDKNVFIFLPIRKFLEVETLEWIPPFQVEGANIFISKSNPKTLEMDIYQFSEDLILKENQWGIPEPVQGNKVEPDLIDIVVTPLLISDQKGFRVGYGKGFYDRFFKICPNSLKVGVNFFDPIYQIQDIDQNDISLDALVLPEKFHAYK